MMWVGGIKEALEERKKDLNTVRSLETDLPCMRDKVETCESALGKSKI